MSAAVAVGCLCVSSVATAFDATDVPTVFSIRKSDNDNRVDYGIHLDAQCHAEGDAPVEAYWRSLELGPGVTEHISLLQRRVYGIESQSVRGASDGSDVTIRLRARGLRAIVVHTRLHGAGCKAWATTAIDGVQAVLLDVYVVLAERLRIDHVELTGRTPHGTTVVERIRP